MDRVAQGQTLGDRDRQEDSVRIVHQGVNSTDGELLLMLADGMGGHAGGEVASDLAISAFVDHFQNVSGNMRPLGRMQEALGASNTALAQRVAQDPALQGMGCTMLAVLVVAGRIVWCSVGDSVLFLLRNGTLRRLNADHSYLGELMTLVKRGELSREEAEAHPRKNALRSAVTGDPLKLVDLKVIASEPGDMVILASDGLETLSDDHIARIAYDNAAGGPAQVTQALLAAVTDRARPRQDNTSVIVLREAGNTQSIARSDSKWADTRSARSYVLPAVIGVVSLLGFGMLGYALRGSDDAPPPVAQILPAPDPVTPPVASPPDPIPTSALRDQEASSGIGGPAPVPDTLPPQTGLVVPNAESSAPSDAVPDADPPQTASPPFTIKPRQRPIDLGETPAEMPAPAPSGGE